MLIILKSVKDYYMEKGLNLFVNLKSGIELKSRDYKRVDFFSIYKKFIFC